MPIGSLRFGPGDGWGFGSGSGCVMARAPTIPPIMHPKAAVGGTSVVAPYRRAILLRNPSPRPTRPTSASGYLGPLRHDENYKRLFAFPRMVEDLLRGFVGGEWIDEVDFSSLHKLSAEYVSDELRERRGDAVWRVGRRGGWLHVLVLLGLQSRDDPDMALRILEYTTLLYRELGRNRALGPDGRRPPVLPGVLYNGASPWTAAVEVVRLARELGLAKFGKLSIDGTKIRANASKHKAMSYGRMVHEERRLEGEIEALLSRARDTDAEEDARFGESLRGDELPEELRRRADRLAAIRAAKERLESAQREADDARGRQPGQDRNPKGGRPYKREYGEPEAKAQSNFTDPESRIMKTSAEGFQQCYNAQVAVDGERQLVVATKLTANASDQGELPAVLDEVKDTFGECPHTALADAGYCNERDLAELEARDIDGYVALGREGKQATVADPEKHPATQRMAAKLWGYPVSVDG